MPLTHTAPFAVRHYELDGYSHVNNTVYLRYLQEAAIQASTAAGYGPERYVALNRAWHVHETEIEYLHALKYGDTVNVRTWVSDIGADFSSVRSRRMYELFRAGNDELVARAYSDWVFLDTTTGRPAPIPPELRLAFFPDGEARATLKRDRFPEPPSPPPGAFVMRRHVEWRDMDVEGHVNNATYLAYIGECAYQAAAALGWPAERTWAEGFGILARKHRIQYLQPAAYDDELEISTYLFDVGGASATRHFRLTRMSDRALIARVNSLYVWVDRATLRPTRMPAHIRDDIAPNIAETK